MRPGNRHEQVAREERPRIRGRFAPGHSGNPDGRPKVFTEIRQLARTHGADAIARLYALMYSEDEQVSVAACRVLLDRGYGHPAQEIAITALPSFDGEATVVTDPVEAAQAYERIMRGELSPDAVRIESALARGADGKAARRLAASAPAPEAPR